VSRWEHQFSVGSWHSQLSVTAQIMAQMSHLTA
jgi:hypothetical protein